MISSPCAWPSTASVTDWPAPNAFINSGGTACYSLSGSVARAILQAAACRRQSHVATVRSFVGSSNALAGWIASKPLKACSSARSPLRWPTSTDTSTTRSAFHNAAHRSLALASCRSLSRPARRGGQCCSHLRRGHATRQHHIRAVPEGCGLLAAGLLDHQLHQGAEVEVADHPRRASRSATTYWDTPPDAWTRGRPRARGRRLRGWLTRPSATSRSSSDGISMPVSRATGLPRSVTITSSPVCARRRHFLRSVAAVRCRLQTSCHSLRT